MLASMSNLPVPLLRAILDEFEAQPPDIILTAEQAQALQNEFLSRRKPIGWNLYAVGNLVAARPIASRGRLPCMLVAETLEALRAKRPTGLIPIGRERLYEREITESWWHTPAQSDRLARRRGAELTIASDRLDANVIAPSTSRIVK